MMNEKYIFGFVSIGLGLLGIFAPGVGFILGLFIGLYLLRGFKL